MKGLLRRYKLSLMYDTCKLSESEYDICTKLDKIFSGLTKKTLKGDVICYVNVDNVWVFDYNTNNLKIDIYLNRDFSIDLKIDNQIIIDWLEDLYDINIWVITWSRFKPAL